MPVIFYKNKAYGIGIATGTIKSVNGKTPDAANNVTIDGGDIVKDVTLLGSPTIRQALDDEATAREGADTALQGNIDTEATAREDADTALQTNIDAVQGNLDTETTNREDADTTLQTNIDEKLARVDDPDNLDRAYVVASDGDQTMCAVDQADATADTIARRTDKGQVKTASPDLDLDAANKKYVDDADTTLQTNINGEEASREHEDLVLRDLLDDEATAREDADSALQTNINTAQSNLDLTDQAINEETENREGADLIPQDNIDDETTARENADTTLQTNIDAKADKFGYYASDMTINYNSSAQLQIDKTNKAGDGRPVKEYTVLINAGDNITFGAGGTPDNPILTLNSNDDTKVDKVSTNSQVYGASSTGVQTTYDLSSFGAVDDVKVNGTTVVTDKVANIDLTGKVDKNTTSNKDEAYGKTSGNTETRYEISDTAEDHGGALARYKANGALSVITPASPSGDNVVSVDYLNAVIASAEMESFPLISDLENIIFDGAVNYGSSITGIGKEALIVDTAEPNYNYDVEYYEDNVLQSTSRAKYRNGVIGLHEGQIVEYYILPNGDWEVLGVDLTNYYNKTQTDNLLDSRVEKITSTTDNLVTFANAGGTLKDSLTAITTTAPDGSSTDATIPTSKAVYAVAEELEGEIADKLDKKTTDGEFVYIHNGTSQNEKAYTLAPTASAIAERTNSGTLRGATATDTNDLVPLSQMNTVVEELEEEINQKQDILSGTENTVATYTATAGVMGGIVVGGAVNQGSSALVTGGGIYAYVFNIAGSINTVLDSINGEVV